FFIQAEDGIRDATVTGVQTCALPISRPDVCFYSTPLDANPRERVAGYQRFTRPSRDVVIVSVCDPRRSTTRVFDAPHPMPVGPNTTSGLDTSSVTPCVIGPGQRW